MKHINSPNIQVRASVLRENVMEASRNLSASDKDTLYRSLESVLEVVSSLRILTNKYCISQDLLRDSMLSATKGSKAVEDLLEHLSCESAQRIGLELKKEGYLRTHEIDDPIGRVKVITTSLTALQGEVGGVDTRATST